MSDALIAAAEIGEEARAFLESDLGKYIIGVAQQEAQLALEKLAEIDPSRIEEVRKTQNEVRVARMFEQWLLEALHDGEQAMLIFKQQEQT